MADAIIDVHDQLPRHDPVYDRFIETQSSRSLVTDLLGAPVWSYCAQGCPMCRWVVGSRR